MMSTCNGIMSGNYITILTDRRYSSTVTKSYRLYFINCEGTESSLEECSVSYTTSTYCRYYYQVTCRQCVLYYFYLLPILLSSHMSTVWVSF